jgi:hypothetical protein
MSGLQWSSEVECILIKLAWMQSSMFTKAGWILLRSGILVPLGDPNDTQIEKKRRRICEW